MSIRDRLLSSLLVTKTVRFFCLSVALALGGCVLDGTYDDESASAAEPAQQTSYEINLNDPSPDEGNGRDEVEQSSAQSSSSMETPGDAIIDPHPDPWMKTGDNKKPGHKD